MPQWISPVVSKAAHTSCLPCWMVSGCSCRRWSRTTLVREFGTPELAPPLVLYMGACTRDWPKTWLTTGIAANRWGCTN